MCIFSVIQSNEVTVIAPLLDSYSQSSSMLAMLQDSFPNEDIALFAAGTNRQSYWISILNLPTFL